jgi:Leucine-rich repeat (LRR) protein
MVPFPLCGNLKELKLRYGNSYKKLKYVPIPVELLAQLAKLTVNECVFREWSLEKDEEETGTSRLKQSRGERTLSNLSSSIDMSRLLQLQHVELYKTEISEISFAEGFCPSLQHLFIKSCNHLVKVGTLPNSLIKLELTSCSKLTKIEGLCGLAKLQMLNIKWCNELEELSSTETLVSLEVLDVDKCTKPKRIERLAQLTELQRLDIVECCELEELPGVEHLKSLKWLDASGCPKLRWGEGVVEKLRQRQLAYLRL